MQQIKVLYLVFTIKIVLLIKIILNDKIELIIFEKLKISQLLKNIIKYLK